MQRLFGGLVFAVVCVGVPFAGGTEEGEPDAVGGTITLYTSESSSDVEGYVRQFELSNPGTTVAVFRLGTTELVARLLTELEAGATPADVVWFADMALFERLAADGDLLAVDPPEAANIPENYVYFGGMVRSQIEQGAPVGYVYQQEGAVYVPTPIGVLASSDNPELATTSARCSLRRVHR